MQAYRRLSHNHALDYACTCARELKKPLVIYEGLRLDYPWASARHHRFILEGMRDNLTVARERGLVYWPFVQTPHDSGKGLVHRLAENACLVVTDDWPCFVVPAQTKALAGRTSRRVVAVDSNSVVPLANLGAAVAAAAHLRPRIQKAFGEAFKHRSRALPEFGTVGNTGLSAPFPTWDGDVESTLRSIVFRDVVPPVKGVVGGPAAAQKQLRSFVEKRLSRYAEERSNPVPPENGAASGLSPYLHYGHLSIEQVAFEVLQSAYGTCEFEMGKSGRREGFYGSNPNVNSFLDEALTWRDVGHHWLFHRLGDEQTLKTALPTWAFSTLEKHTQDERKYVYSAEQLETAKTHDPLWNAAQTELVKTGTIHNYLRMLWGKKVLEWSGTPEEAYQVLVHLNNKYALDGRDPNSYTGILWCFGLFDRPWPPERPVFGNIRYMSSDNTAKKFKVGAYLDYVKSL
ncbi:MAG: deoxyribodipyrimidine photolyase [Polyangiaceae bacterium]|nr:deoxyribodipyrimidine photolyase [Polyangiaceae bacterium]